jgi:hypothetical protein
MLILLCKRKCDGTVQFFIFSFGLIILNVNNHPKQFKLCLISFQIKLYYYSGKLNRKDYS